MNDCFSELTYFTCFAGELCESDFDECEHRDICSSRGECVNTQGSFVCDCEDGYGGSFCLTPLLKTALVNCNSDRVPMKVGAFFLGLLPGLVFAVLLFCSRLDENKRFRKFLYDD